MSDLSKALESLQAVSVALYDIRNPPKCGDMAKMYQDFADVLHRWEREERRLQLMRDVSSLRNSGKTFKEIASELKISVSRAVQWRNSAVRRIRHGGTLFSRPRPMVVTVG